MKVHFEVFSEKTTSLVVLYCKYTCKCSLSEHNIILIVHYLPVHYILFLQFKYTTMFLFK